MKREKDVKTDVMEMEEAQSQTEIDEGTSEELEFEQTPGEPQAEQTEEKTGGAELELEQLKAEPAESQAEQTEEKAEGKITHTELELEQLKAEVEVARDRMLRTAAEFENYKKRAEREKNDFMKYISIEFVSDLLPIMDNLERAIGATAEPNSEGQNFESFTEGIKLIYKQLQDVLTKRGVTEIESIGKPFDPNIHEAVMQVPSDKYPANTVVEEFQKGYMLHDRVIRASVVSVSMGKSQTGEEVDKDE